MSVGIIITKGLAPYRLDFYDAIASHADVDRLQVCVPEAKGHDHPWSNLDEGREIDLVEIAASENFNIFWRLLAVFGYKKPDHTAGFSGALWRHLSDEKPSWILGHEGSPYVLTGLMWAVVKGVPYYLSSELGKHSPKTVVNKPTWLVHSLCELFIKGKVANTQQAMTPFIRSKLQCVFAPHAIDTREYEPALERGEGEPIRGVFVGNLIERKGIDLLIAALAELDSSVRSKVLIDLVGVDKDGLYEEMASRQGVSDALLFSGFQEGEALRQHYRDADFFILPTREDTYAVVTHEAAASGLALVVSKHAGSAEVLVEDKETGMVFNPLSIPEFVGCLEQIAARSDYFAKEKKKSRILAQEYCVSKAGKAVAEWIQNKT